MLIRKPAVAGMFYPRNPKELKEMLKEMLAKANADLPIPKAIIAPHAGYIYSGPIAASAYTCLAKTNKINKVVLLGPAHRYPFKGLALPKADIFSTPLGDIKIDKDSFPKLLELEQVNIIPEAHAQEHSLEVQLPFLQTILSSFTLIPLVVGMSNPEEIAEVLEQLWDGEETLIVISSDLSHYHEYSAAEKLDKATTTAILNLDIDKLSHEAACGCTPIQGLLKVAKQKHLQIELIDLKSSGDTAGDKDHVVGYGAFHVR